MIELGYLKDTSKLFSVCVSAKYSANFQLVFTCAAQKRSIPRNPISSSSAPLIKKRKKKKDLSDVFDNVHFSIRACAFSILRRRSC